MVNVWKISTLVLAGALAVVVGRGAVQESEACDNVADIPSPEQVTRLRLARGFAFLERAEQEIEAATAARPKERANVLAQIAKAKATIELALAPAVAPVVEPKPLPRPRPVVNATFARKDVVDPFATPPSTVHAKTTTTPQGEVINPFLRRDPLARRN
jgi:hypothetical protein